MRSRKRLFRLANPAALQLADVLVRLPPTLSDFTVEFWARGAPAVDPSVLISRGVERAYQIVWSSGDEALPHVVLELEKTGLTTIVAKKNAPPITSG